MDTSHHQALLAGYATAMIGWLVIRRWLPELWPTRRVENFARPWWEFAGAMIAVTAVLGLGQLYQRGWLLPTEGRFGLVLDTANQVLLFSPMILLLLVRRHPLATAWVPTRRVHLRLAVGLALALSALVSFALVQTSLQRWPDLVASVYQPSHAHFALHIFLEDVTIAILFVRLAAAMQRQWLAAVVVAGLFAAGHIPGALSSGAALAELLPLTLDIMLGVGILLVVYRSADIWWFWCVHFAMDMTQFFEAATG